MLNFWIQHFSSDPPQSMQYKAVFPFSIASPRSQAMLLVPFPVISRLGSLCPPVGLLELRAIGESVSETTTDRTSFQGTSRYCSRVIYRKQELRDPTKFDTISTLSLPR